jgi:hypothetical protein
LKIYTAITKGYSTSRLRLNDLPPLTASWSTVRYDVKMPSR